ncbi:MAG: glycosyltransferase family 4 protein [Verrucomicrobia bacterium]|nr:glycosyltransferase family 4 protein [Verrucomicrobiota bacterium]
MKILLLNQTFHPDVVSTAQHLSDLAVELARRGHEVTVLCGRRAYDDPRMIFPRKETWKGVQIHRVFSTSFGKQAKWRRAVDFASFIASCCARLLLLRRQDRVVALTSPPLISFIGAWMARWWRARFCYWVMDFNPDEAIAAGWLRADSLAGRILDRMSCFSLRRADRIIALDRFMRDRIAAKGIAPDKIIVIPPWSHDDEVGFDAAGRERFRKAHGLAGKFVVMYSGNHSPCHPLDTLLEAAQQLGCEERFVFVFVGGGSEFLKIQALSEMQKAESRKQKPERAESGGEKSESGNLKTEITSSLSRPIPTLNSQLSTFGTESINPQLSTIRCLPYQPLGELAGSLSAADLHVVVMGDPFVGLVHPCKIYNVLAVGSPVLYIGPEASHLAEILAALNSRVCARVGHGEVDECVAQIRRIARENQRGESGPYEAVSAQFSRALLLPELVRKLEPG